MPTKTEIIEAGAGALHDTQWSGDWGVANEYERMIFTKQAEAALSAMLPLLKQALSDSVRFAHIQDPWPQEQDACEYEEWFDVGIEYATKRIRDFEL